MLSSEDKKWSTPTLIFCLMVVVLFTWYLAYNYFSTRPPSLTDERINYITKYAQPTAKPHQLVLPKGKQLVIGRNGLVFRGVEKKVVTVDLYLLDMDAEQAYGKRFSKKDAKKEMAIGEGKYRLVSVNDKYLILKILSTPPTY